MRMHLIAARRAERRATIATTRVRTSLGNAYVWQHHGGWVVTQQDPNLGINLDHLRYTMRHPTHRAAVAYAQEM